MVLANNAHVKVNFLLFLGVASEMFPVTKTIKENFYFLKENLCCLEKFLPKREFLPYYDIFY